MSDLDQSAALHGDPDDDFTLGQDQFHTLTLVERCESSPDDPNAEANFSAYIFCPGDHPGNSCDECRESRTPAFDDLSWDAACPMRQIHGEWHVWSTDGFWALPYPGCLVAEGDYWGSALGIMDAHGPGTYLVEVEWEEEDPWLIAVSDDGSRLPDGNALDNRRI